MPTRRTFLKGVAGSLGLLGLAGCRTNHAAAGGMAQVLPVARAPKTSAVALVRPSAHPRLADAVRAVVAQAGGFGFIKEGQRVLLKPAVNSARRYPSTTDPEVVLVVAQLVLEAGGTPFIADRTMFMRSTARTFHQLGLDDAARQARISCQSLDHAEVTRLAHPGVTHWSGGEVPIYLPVAQADHVINLCTPRTHKLGDFTMALKNLVGVVDGGARMGMHMGAGFKERLAEISLVVPSAFVLMDGREGFTDGGPDSGDLAKLDFLAASRDPVAIDAVGLGFLRLAGANDRIMRGSIWELPVLKQAAALDLGASSVERIALSGLPEADLEKLRAQLASA